MWWLIGIGTYVFSFAVVWAFIRGANRYECPKPEQAVAIPTLLPQMQSEATESMMAYAVQRRSVWETEISYSQAP